MEITFRGVRGSYPVAAPHSLRCGGNTSCIEVWAGDTCLIIDAGTGIRTLGDGMKNGASELKQIRREHLQNSARDLAHRADLLICDTFFLPGEYQPDWGHSRPEDGLRLADEAQVQRLALFHHEPHRSD